MRVMGAQEHFTSFCGGLALTELLGQHVEAAHDFGLFEQCSCLALDFVECFADLKCWQQLQKEQLLRWVASFLRNEA